MISSKGNITGVISTKQYLKGKLNNAVINNIMDSSIVIYDTEEDEAIKTKLLSTVNDGHELIKPAFLISDGMMLFILADVDTEDGKKQFRFKAGNLIDMEGQKMSYSVEILYRISSTGELEKDYATGMFFDNETIIQNVNDIIDEKITGALGGDY